MVWIILIVIVVLFVIGITAKEKTTHRKGSSTPSGYDRVTDNNPLGMCNSCLSINLGEFNIRTLVNKGVFNTLDGKSVLIFRLFMYNGCFSCKEKAKNHLQSFVSSHGHDFDVEVFYNRCKNL